MMLSSMTSDLFFCIRRLLHAGLYSCVIIYEGVASIIYLSQFHLNVAHIL